MNGKRESLSTLDCPMNFVSWHMAAAYCNWLSRGEGVSEVYETNGAEIRLKANHLNLAGYRLPTEAEMEYATRAGSVTSRYFGETDDLLPKYAWFNVNSQEKSWPVGSLKPNDWGLFDVHGNVWTWCQGILKDYPQGMQSNEDQGDDGVVDPTVSRALRGGSFFYPSAIVRSADRGYDGPTGRFSNHGFRLARTIPLPGHSVLTALPVISEKQ